jgi:hypothetical protein
VIRTLAMVTLTLLVGAAVAGAAYWGFLSTPESTAWTLGLSALLVVVTLVVAVAAINVAMLLWGRDTPPAADAPVGAASTTGALVRRALRGAPACIPALVVLGAAWWLTSTVDTWVQVHSGEISAWFIATMGWSDMRWMFTAAGWALTWVIAVLAPLAGLVWWNAALRGQWRPSRAVVRRAVNLKALALATAAVGLLVWVPWTYLTPWRPRGLPAGGTTELAFVAVKLGLSAVLMATGAALVTRAAAARIGHD